MKRVFATSCRSLRNSAQMSRSHTATRCQTDLVYWRCDDLRPTARGSSRDRKGRMLQVEHDPVQALCDACPPDLGNPDLWFEPDGYPDSLALCIIDSIYSTGAHYSSVVNVV